MKYTLTRTIALPRNRVAELFSNSDNWHKWQPTLISYETISGEVGAVGSKTRLVHRFGRRTTEMIETIESNTLPKEMVCIYEAKGAWNRVVSRFIELSPHETQWEFESEFKCGGILKIMALFVPRMFRNATIKDMHSFIAFAEASERSQ